MRDPELVFNAQLAASALERAWQRWRVVHGLVADPMPTISSYVGYSLEEPWGQPRVVFGLSAGDAEQLSALLDRHDCVGPVHAMIATQPGGRKLAADGVAARRLPAPRASSALAERSVSPDRQHSTQPATDAGPAQPADWVDDQDGPVFRQVAAAARLAAVAQRLRETDTLGGPAEAAAANDGGDAVWAGHEAAGKQQADTGPIQAPAQTGPKQAGTGPKQAGTGPKQGATGPKQARVEPTVAALAMPALAVPGQAVPGSAVPGQAVPGQAVPGPAASADGRAAVPPAEAASRAGHDAVSEQNAVSAQNVGSALDATALDAGLVPDAAAQRDAASQAGPASAGGPPAAEDSPDAVGSAGAADWRWSDAGDSAGAGDWRWSDEGGSTDVGDWRWSDADGSTGAAGSTDAAGLPDAAGHASPAGRGRASRQEASHAGDQPVDQPDDGPGPLALAASAARVEAESRIRAALHQARWSAPEPSLPDDSRDEGGPERAQPPATGRGSGFALPGDLASSWGSREFGAADAADNADATDDTDAGQVESAPAPFQPRANLAAYLDAGPEPGPSFAEPRDQAPSGFTRRNRISRGYSIPRLSRPKRPGAVPGAQQPG